MSRFHCTSSVASWTVVSTVRAVTTGLLLAVLPAGLVLTAPVQAAPLDLRLEGFSDPSTASGTKITSKSYTTLMREVSTLMGQRMAGPAASQGALGMDIAYEMSFVGLDANAEYWKKAVAKPVSSATTSQIRVRKGLPHQVQIGGSVVHAHDSNLWAIGAELNLSLLDGFRHIPDFALRAGGNTVVGTRGLTMVNAGGDVTASKSFGIGGVLALQPWLGYSLGWTYVEEYKINVMLNPNTTELRTQRLPQLFEIGHRAAFGFRVVAAHVQVGVELLRSFSEGMNVMTAKIGTAF